MVLRWSLIVLAGLALAASPAAAQTPPAAPEKKPLRRPKPTQPTQDQPADPDATTNPGGPGAPNQTKPNTPAQPGATEPEVVEGPFIEKQNERTWKFTARVHVQGWQGLVDKGGGMGQPAVGVEYDVWKFDTLAVVFPIMNSTGNAKVTDKSWSGELLINDKAVDEEPTILTGYGCGERLGRWDATDGQARQATLSVAYEITTAKTVFKEAEANAVPWPKGAWPAEVASALQPQLFVEIGVDINGATRPYDPSPLTSAIRKWLDEEGVKEGKDVPPARLAKILAGKVQREVQPSGDGLAFNRVGQLEGLNLKPPSTVLADGRGSEQDLPILLTAIYRAAGLPARVVVGFDTGGSGRSNQFLKDGKGSRQVRTWCEFALYVEPTSAGAKGQLNWIPVDITQMRKSSNRPASIERPWRYFGGHDDMDNLVPFTFHLFPPTAGVVSYGSPGFWGWMMTPNSPKTARQGITLRAETATKRPAKKDRSQ